MKPRLAFLFFTSPYFLPVLQQRGGDMSQTLHEAGRDELG